MNNLMNKKNIKLYKDSTNQQIDEKTEEVFTLREIKNQSIDNLQDCVFILNQNEHEKMSSDIQNLNFV